MGGLGGSVRGEGQGGRVGGQGRCERRSEVFVKIQNKWGRGVWGSGWGSGWGVRVDVNEKLKFLRKFNKQKFRGGGGGGGSGEGQVGGGGSG